jgi:CspA family cold shock protein
MAIGQVKWFNSQKGYGFLESADSEQDVFVHFSDIQMSGYKTLKEKSWVHFVLEERGKGPNARQVCPLLTESVARDGWSGGMASGVQVHELLMQTEAAPA